jgi:CheY-like chemotaxis protein
MKYFIAVIEDCPTSQEIAKELLGQDSRLDVQVFNSPRDFLMRGKSFDLILSDWNFEHTQLGFYLENFDRSKLIIITGSLMLPEVKCISVLHKLEYAEKLPKMIDKLIKRTRSSW